MKTRLNWLCVHVEILEKQKMFSMMMTTFKLIKFINVEVKLEDHTM